MAGELSQFDQTELRELVGRLAQSIYYGKVGGNPPPTTSSVSSAHQLADSFYVDGVLTFTTGELAGEQFTITANTTSTFTLSPVANIAPNVGDEYYILPAVADISATVSENVAKIGGVTVPGSPIGTAGGVAPTVATQVAGSDGTDLRAIKTDSTGTVQVGLTGNNVPLVAAAPTLVATVPYTSFTTASASIYPYFPQTLSRNARARTFSLVNELNEALTTGSIALCDSTYMGTGSTPTYSVGGDTVALGAAASDQSYIKSSEETSSGNAGMLAAHVDSFQLILGMGATLPTSGNVKLYMTEVF